MPFLFIYILKLSVSLAVVFLFYHFLLRKLTFYNWNRWYLLGYTLLSFVIPFLNITPALHKNELTDVSVVQWVPLLYSPSANTSFAIENILLLLIITGMLILLIRLIVQFISFRRMKKKATFISDDGIRLYQVNESIIPFSFGNAVFINRHLHTSEELEEIIRHEFVHVKQRHSIDVMLGEILCLLNWFNPFAWLLRKSIRQNLEFIADNKVIENGFNKKQYQYLLLKVIGNNQFSIAPKFNFSSLKKRIAMMNKNKSTKMHLLRFLFLLPVLAFILVSFRKDIGDTLSGKQKHLQLLPVTDATDTIPETTKPNNRGYIINVKDKKGECLLVIKDKTGKEVKRLLLTEWNTASEKYEALYGEIPPPPPPTAPQAPVSATESMAPVAPISPIPPVSTTAPLPPAAPIKSEQLNSVVVALKENSKAVDASLDGPGNPNSVYIKGSIEVKSDLPDNVVYIIDGIIESKKVMNTLDPQSIESINVLKGQSATALYGEKGKNGVIIITTKKGATIKKNEAQL